MALKEKLSQPYPLDTFNEAVKKYSVVKLEGSVMKQVATSLYVGPKINLSTYFNIHAEKENALNGIGKKAAWQPVQA